MCEHVYGIIIINVNIVGEDEKSGELGELYRRFDIFGGGVVGVDVCVFIISCTSAGRK